MITLFSYIEKRDFKVSRSARFLGGTGGKIGLNVEKLSFSKGLSRNFSRLSLTHQNILCYTFSDQIDHLKPQKAPKKLKKLYFWTTFKQLPHFLPSPSPHFGAKFQIL